MSAFKKNDRINYVASICTNEKLTTTWIAVLDYDKALNCLKKTTAQGSRRITIIRYGSEQKFYYGGVGYEENQYESCYFDHTKYFDKPKGNGKE